VDPEFWHERWSRGEIGFHQHDYNAHMRSFVEELRIKRGANVLVPLCGKSRDMIWLLYQGYRVTGVEISPRAVRDFFEEHSIAHGVTELPGAHLFRGPHLDIYCGDFFSVDLTGAARFDAVYDRASLVALPPQMRERYVERLTALVPEGTRSLLVTMQYPQKEMRGPPFSVPEEEVRKAFGGSWTVDRLHEEDCLEQQPRFRKKGLSRLTERVFLLRRTRPAGGS
jgi:thiopurine S-methyltransferase